MARFNVYGIPCENRVNFGPKWVNVKANELINRGIRNNQIRYSHMYIEMRSDRHYDGPLAPIRPGYKHRAHDP